MEKLRNSSRFEEAEDGVESTSSQEDGEETNDPSRGHAHPRLVLDRHDKLVKLSGNLWNYK